MSKHGMPIKDRFLQYVEKKPGSCWEWTGGKNNKGYGSFHIRKGYKTTAHRASWLIFVGPIPSGKEIDHKCLNKSCVNPSHLRLMTHKQNNASGMRRKRYKETHCAKGHEYTEENTYVDSCGIRRCRSCRRHYQQQYRRQRSGKIV